MGYTNYLTIKKTSSREIEKKYQQAIKKIDKLVKYAYNTACLPLSGYSAHAKGYGGIKFNGKQDNAHEDFILREHFKENENFSFCKTARKPYDIVVKASLLVLKHALKDIVIISCDGNKEDWLDGLKLAKKALGLKSLLIDIK